MQASTFLNSRTLPLAPASSLFLVSHFSPLSRSSIITLAWLPRARHPFLPSVYWLHQNPDGGNVRQRGRGRRGRRLHCFCRLSGLLGLLLPVPRVALPQSHYCALIYVSSVPLRHSSAASSFPSFPTVPPLPPREPFFVSSSVKRIYCAF